MHCSGIHRGSGVTGCCLGKKQSRKHTAEGTAALSRLHYAVAVPVEGPSEGAKSALDGFAIPNRDLPRRLAQE